MMNKLLFALSVLFLIFLSSCQKTELSISDGADNLSSADKTANSLMAPGKGTEADAHWYGTYYAAIDSHGSPINTDEDPDLPPSISDEQIISGGVAKVPWLSGAASFYATLSFTIPTRYNLPGDSIIYEAVVKNQSNNGGLPGYDVILSLIGERGDTAYVRLVGDKAYQSGTYYFLGDTRYTNIPALVQDFSTFQTLKLATKKGQTGVYLNNKLLAHFKYKAADKLGRIYRIEVSSKGTALVDNIKITNSYTNKKLMQEDFNTEGQSHAIFY